MKPLLTERCERIRSFFPSMGAIRGNSRWIRVRSPNYDSLAYSILYCAKSEFRRANIDKVSTVYDLVRQLNETSPITEASLKDIAKSLELRIVIFWKDRTSWDSVIYGDDEFGSDRYIYILKVNKVHYEPTAIYNNIGDKFEFLIYY